MPMFARIETSHFVIEIKGLDQLLAIFYDMETLWEDWIKYEQNG